MPSVEDAVKSNQRIRSQSSGSTVSIGHSRIHVKGKPVVVPSTKIEGRTVIKTGRWLTTATIKDEDLVEGETVADPTSFVSQLKNTGLNADIFTFAEKLPRTTPQFTYHIEWDNMAVIPITTFTDWWEKRVDPGVRRAVRKAAKTGIIVKAENLDDAFVKGIVSVNNETPIRQGRAFWHFKKPFEAVKAENSTYCERNTFLGAYYQNELIGFIRITYTDSVANIVQLLTMIRHYDKRPANALIAKAVEHCEQRGVSHLMYYSYVYNDPESSLTEFKRRNGFEKVLLPRYYIPMTVKGRIALKLGLHRGLAQSIPKPLLVRLLKVRSLWYARKLKAIEGTH